MGYCLSTRLNVHYSPLDQMAAAVSAPTIPRMQVDFDVIKMVPDRIFFFFLLARSAVVVHLLLPSPPLLWLEHMVQGTGAP